VLDAAEEDWAHALSQTMWTLNTLLSATTWLNPARGAKVTAEIAALVARYGYPFPYAELASKR